MEVLTTIATNPYIYVIPLGFLASMYCGWALARRQYLSVNKLFNLVALAIVGGWATAVIAQLIAAPPALPLLSADFLWVHPRPLFVLIGYIGLALVVSRYIRVIRYPYWRTIDMVAAALSIFWVFLLIGWCLQYPALPTFGILFAATISAVLTIWIGIRVERHGLATAIHIVTAFLMLGSTRFAIPAWQETTTIVEWTAVGIGVFTGLGITLVRISSRSEKVILQDIPRGVSHSFYETFTRAFKHKQLPDDKG